MGTHRLVIVGGGFGGLQAAMKLRRAPVEVTVIDRRNFHLFQPLTIRWLPARCRQQKSRIRCEIFKRARNVKVMMAEVADFDLSPRSGAAPPSPTSRGSS